ncbi:hypothetical protein DPMN_047817 [Dreissena polymorpha]|uniref:Uncharacterized protein n=1 Tax=Dreissena polymorpha TaxID=45954 RepID=A0A9D4I1R9_DREPO|nr:hypothetical protein DPMN_047817 [Dreissena polymorpha]
MQASLIDRARMMTPSMLRMDRLPPEWSNLFDKGSMDFRNHRLSFQREMEQARDHLFGRYPGPTGIPLGFPPGLSHFEQERFKDEMYFREKKEYMDRLPVYERERLFYENKLPPDLRPQDHLHPPFTVMPTQ